MALSWWPCLGGLVRQVEWVHPHPQLAKNPPKFLVYLLTIVVMLGEEEPTSQLGWCEIMHGPKLQTGQGGSVSVPPSIEGTLWSNPMGAVVQ